MALQIDTYDNRTGGKCLFKAIGHPLTVDAARGIVSTLEAAGPVAIYDPNRMVEPVHALFPLDAVSIAGVFVQDVADIGAEVLGHQAQPVTDLPGCDASTVFIPGFDCDRLIDQARHLFAKDVQVVTLDDMRLPQEMLTNARRYLDPLNFATNFAFFRDGGGHHTRLVTANYWTGYGARAPRIWCRLFDAAGVSLAEWWIDEPGPANSTITIDSKAVREQHGLDDFCGQLFVHVVGVAGHEVVKYALDTYGDDETVLSCTHDANAWPSDLYAGLPAPEDGEKVVLWVQNSHPTPIPKGAIGLNRMGTAAIARLDLEIPGFGSYPLDVHDLLPDLQWPGQIEIQAGKHFVRPRYEVTKTNGRMRISHPNVERVDLKLDPKIPELSDLMGKGFVLPAPVLPVAGYRSEALPTPMSTAQATMPVAAIVYSSKGQEIGRHRFGNLPRGHAECLDTGALAGDALEGGYGHVELIYDFSGDGDGGGADGWLHGLFRYTDRRTGHAADTSFGAHMFNHILVYKGEPQSYAGPAPGLSTRLFLRTGPGACDAFCQLIYTSSTEWRETSETRLCLTNRHGEAVAERDIAIPLNGSYYFRYSQIFSDDERDRAGEDAYVLIRDATCRLFGYHGLILDGKSFSLDHMFGF